MKNIFVFILLFALATNQETYHIFNISSIQCSPYNGYGLFGVNFEESIPVPGSDKTFQLVLKSSDGSPSINAYCSFNGISEDITYDESYEVTSEESENLDETTETFLEDRTSEIDSSFENEATDIESRENMVDEAISAESSEENEIISEKDESSDELIDEAFESGTDSNEFLSETEKISDETLTETVETGNDSEESTSTVSEEQTDSDEKLKETEEADNDSEESTKSVSEEQSDEAEAEEETLSGGLRRLSQINKKKKIKIVKKRRRLNDDEYYDNLFNDYGASCYFESPQYSGRYTIDSVTSNDENINVELYESGAIISDLIHCIDEEWAQSLLNLNISFRQVNSFEIDKEGNAQFYLYGLTTEELVKFSFALEIYLLINGEKSTETTEINCSNDETIEIPELGIAPVLFICSFTSTEQVTSIEIVGSEVMVGFPTDKSLLNPVLTDEKINNGELLNMTDPDVFGAAPTIIDIQEFNFENAQSEGTFEIIGNCNSENLKVGQSFEFPLAFPSGIVVTMTIKEINSGEITAECTLNTEVENQPLYFDQRTIILDGKELFTFPGFKTNSPASIIATEKSEEETSEETTETSADETVETATDEKTETSSDEAIETLDNELAETSTDESAETTADETAERSSDETSEILDDEREEVTDEISEKSETSITETTTEPQTDISLEDAELAANMTLSFRQVNSFEIDKEGNAQFYLYGLTTEELVKFSFALEIYLLINGEKSTETTEINCSNDETIEIPELGIAPVLFICSFTSTEQVTSIEIVGSEVMVGFPTDKSLLNPVLTDEKINNGELLNMTDPDVFGAAPTIIDIQEFNFDNVEKEGTFEIIAALKEESSDLKKGQSFEISLAYPSYIDITITITKIDGLEITFECEINGEVDSQPLISEQKVIMLDGKELLVLPGFQTEEITTSGVVVPSEETSSQNGTSTEETTSEETSTEEISSETTTDETTDEETTSEETTTEETTSEETTTEEATSEETTSEETTSEETTSEETTSEETTSEETTSEETTSEELSDTTTGNETSSDTSEISDTSFESDATNSTQPSTEKIDETESTSKEETNRPTFVIDEDVITIEDAKKLLNISLSFRQLKQFEYNSGAVSFIFIGLVSQYISTGHTISILVNLYLESGEMEEEAKQAECTISSSVNPSEGQVVKAIYECKVENLEEVYTSLRFNNSDEIAGVPTDDEVALNPVLTDQAIENKEVIDGEKVKVPPTFVIEEEDHSECSSSGKLKIKGSLTEDTSIVTKFTIPLTYPEGVSLTCSFDINTLDCTLDRDITESLLIEQVMIKEGTKELFILPSFEIEDIKCRNGIIKEVEEKVNVDISFRQVSTIKKITKGFNFFFAAFVNNKLQAKTEIKMKIILLLANATEIEKNATCVLKEDVSPSNGSPIQGDFDCSISLTDEEDKSVGSNYELSVSPDNGDIGGCAELTEQEKSPRLTDLAIAESKEKGDDSLGKVLDFSLTENKEYKPPSFEVTSFNLSSCAETGKFKVKGTFSEDITEELTFNIPFSFPSSEIKCTVKNVTKDEEVEIKCKVQKGFRKVRSFVLEPRLIKKKCVEKLYIKGNKNIELNENAEFKCENFNTIKKQKAILRYKKAHYSFLQLSRPVTKTHRFFFMALRRRVTTHAFARFSIKIKVHVMRSSLRMLQDDLTLDLDDVEVECNVNQTLGDSASYGCSPSVTINAAPTEVEIDDEESLIVGAPDEIEVQTNPTIDLTELSNIETIEKLPSVNITNITSLNCTYTGQFSIIGDLVDSSNQLSSFNKSKSFVVPFATPDSKGVCKINSLTDSNIELICENTEDFSPTQVLISSQVINDANGNPIFKIVNDKTAADLFGCATSENSTLPTADEEAENTGESSTDSITSSDTTSTQGSGLYHRNTSSGGLTGGAIAGIVIACAAVLIAVCVLMGLVKKGALGARKRVAIPIDNSATMAQFNYAQGKN